MYIVLNLVLLPMGQMFLNVINVLTKLIPLTPLVTPSHRNALEIAVMVVVSIYNYMYVFFLVKMGKLWLVSGNRLTNELFSDTLMAI